MSSRYFWAVVTIMMLAMLIFLGARHPPVMDEYEPLAHGRKGVGVFAIIMFVLCFMPVPIDVLK